MYMCIICVIYIPLYHLTPGYRLKKFLHMNSFLKGAPLAFIGKAQIQRQVYYKFRKKVLGQCLNTKHSSWEQMAQVVGFWPSVRDAALSSWILTLAQARHGYCEYLRVNQQMDLFSLLSIYPSIYLSISACPLYKSKKYIKIF